MKGDFDEDELDDFEPDYAGDRMSRLEEAHGLPSELQHVARMGRPQEQDTSTDSVSDVSPLDDLGAETESRERKPCLTHQRPDPQRMAACIPVLETNERLRSDLTALRAERDAQYEQLEWVKGINAALLPYQERAVQAESALAEARARLAVPAWQEEVRKALEFCATATASVTPGYIDVPMTLAFVQAKAKEALALLPPTEPSA